MVDLIKSLSLTINIALVVVCGVIVWIAGTKLSSYADKIATRTGAGQAFVGALLLGSVTSLPEIATTITASYIGSAPLAVNNIFGGVAMQVAILAALDFAIRGKALSYIVKDPSVPLQASLSTILLVFTVLGITLSGSQTLNLPIWTPLMFVFTLAFFYMIKKVQEKNSNNKNDGSDDNSDDDDSDKDSGKHLSNTRLTLYTILAAVAILVAGFIVATSGEAIANKTKLGEGLVGAVLIAITTSLPELSTSIAAVRLKKYELMCSNIFGSNVFDLSLICLADLLYKGPILADIKEFSLVAALVATLVTLCYVVGFQLKRNLVFLRSGIDSWLVLIIYLCGMTVLYLLK